MSPLFYKILLIIQTLNNNKFFDKDNYDDIIKLLCNRKKIQFLRVMISDIFLFLKNEKFLDLEFDLNYKSLKILFISLFTCNEKFYNIVFNNNTEYNNDLKKISLENIKIIKELHSSKYKIIKLIKLANNFNDYHNIYNNWQKVDKRMNVQKLLIDYFEIKVNIDLLDSSNENYQVIKNAYLKELTNIEKNVKYINDENEVTYFSEKKDNYDNYQKMQEELYWQKIKYEISCLDKFKVTIIKLIEKTTKMFIDCVPNNLTVQNEIHENLDIEILNNMLTEDNNGKLDYKYLESRIFYILNVLKRFQSPESDSSYEQWCKEIDVKLTNKVYYKDFIPYFFRELFDRIIEILEQIQKFKENIVI
jgi:hypothetical protein